jgi:alkanesulfonate monooxygenase SsuD/methylene tetrahydromethanopterin reductase-like flavin-dependent oxidoreductase (luciferase family)
MNFGIFLAAQHSDGRLSERASEHIEQVRAAREAGFISVMAGQHHLPDPYQMLHPIPLLARVAAEAPGMFVGTGILLASLYNPVEIADLGSTMDALCQGRFILGLGLGYREVESSAFAVPASKRVAHLEEALDLVPRLWSGEEVTHHSERVHLDHVRFTSPTTRRPRPPIWLAANDDPAVRRAARLADAWLLNPHAKLSVLARQMQLYRAERQRTGKAEPAVIPMFKEICCAETREQAWSDARPFLEEKYRTYVDWGQQRALPAGEDDLNLPFEELQGDRFIIGDPDDVIQQIERILGQLGVNHMLLRMQWSGRQGSLPQEKVLRTIRLLGTHVIPHLGADWGEPDLGAIDAAAGAAAGGAL